LSWAANLEPDLLEYRIYRDATGSFIPSQANLLAVTQELEYLDEEWDDASEFYYKISAVDIHDNENGFAEISPLDITDAGPDDTPSANNLNQNYPNPFNPSTTISFSITKKARVRLNVYDVTGRHVRELLDEDRDAGTWSISWDGCNDDSAVCVSGTYFCRMETDDKYSTTVKMILLR
jgi:hypothetical protein